jgi:L-ribulose-5-phosphate 3-epimerase
MFTKGISYWSFEGGLEGTKPVAEAFREARAAGYESIEVCLSETGDVSLETTEQSATTVVRAARDAGIELSSVASGLFWGKPLTSDEPEIRREALEIAKRLIDVCRWLEADTVLLIPGAVDVFFDPASAVVDYQTVFDRASAAVAQLLPYAESRKVVLGIENVWSKFLVGPHEMRDFIDQFDSPWVGAYFDVGNCMASGYPEQWIRILGSRIARVHLKDYRRSVGTADGFVDLLSGDVNWPAVIAALEGVGYKGYMTAEMIPLYRHYPEILLENTSRAMDAILRR